MRPKVVLVQKNRKEKGSQHGDRLTATLPTEWNVRDAFKEFLDGQIPPRTPDFLERA
jgi:hypothetical protein